MVTILLRRLASSILVLLIIMTVSLWLTRQAPSNPCLKERDANTCACVKQYHLDKPVFPIYIEPILPPTNDCTYWSTDSEVQIGSLHLLSPSEWGDTQYFRYVGTLATGSLGESMQTDRTVLESLGEGIGYTLQLGLQALIIALMLGIPAGLIAGLKQNTIVDYSTMSAAMLGVSIPNIVLGPLLVLLFALKLGWFRAVGWSSFSDSILPSITLGLFYAAYIARLTRGGMLEVIRQNYIRTARAKGLREKTVVLRHAIRGALLPVVSYLGPATAALLTGSVVVEEIFGIPGIGKHFVRSALNRDYNLVLGTIIFYSTVLITMNFLVDIVYSFLDPRVRHDS